MSATIYTPVGQNGQDKDRKKDEQKADISELRDVDTRCGIGFFRFGLIEPCANMGVFTAFISMSTFMTSTLTVYVNSQITTLERQFGFSSKQTGIIMAANDIGYLVFVLFISYMASKIHIPRALGIATVLFGLSGIACSLPHFIFGTSQDSDSNLGTTQGSDSNLEMLNMTSDMKSLMFGSICDLSNATVDDSCHIKAAQTGTISTVTTPEVVSKASYIIIVIGMMLQGLGKAPRSSLGVTYLDDNTAKVNTGFYMGIISTVSMFGPAVAFLMGGIFSKMYVTLQPTTLTPRHPKWIGAWWLGFILFGSLALLFSIPIFCFPRRMPKKINRETDHTENNKTGHERSDDLALIHKTPESHGHHHGNQAKTSAVKKFNLKFVFKHSREFMSSLFRLWTNPVYVCMVASGCFIVFTMGGSGAYMPKYMERMFHLPAHVANYIIAGQVLCTSCIGTFIGGYLTKRMKMTSMKAMKFVIIVVILSVVCHSLGFVFQCEQPVVHNLPGETNDCNSGCSCPANSYFPVCGSDGLTYYSPCHAGCGQADNGGYQNCTCIPGGGATSGTCDYSCPHLYAYVVVMGARSLFGTLSIIPKMIIFIRCVAHQDRPMAMGFSAFVMSLLGWMTGPIVFGFVIDGICTIWDVECGVTGRCLRYDNIMFRLKLHGFGFAGLSMSLICICISFIYAWRTKCLDEPINADGKVKDITAEMILMGTDKEKKHGDTTEKPGLENDDETNENLKSKGDHSVNVA